MAKYQIYTFEDYKVIKEVGSNFYFQTFKHEPSFNSRGSQNVVGPTHL